MKPFAEFCAHYQLDPNTEEADEQYRDYCDKLALFRQAVVEQPKSGSDELGGQIMPTSQGGEA